MTTSLKRFILGTDNESLFDSTLPFGAGFNRFLQTTGDEIADDGPATCNLNSPTPESVAIGTPVIESTPDMEALRNFHEIRSQLSQALASTILLQSQPTSRAPTLRLAVDALRCA